MTGNLQSDTYRPVIRSFTVCSLWVNLIQPQSWRVLASQPVCLVGWFIKTQGLHIVPKCKAVSSPHHYRIMIQNNGIWITVIIHEVYAGNTTNLFKGSVTEKIKYILFLSRHYYHLALHFLYIFWVSQEDAETPILKEETMRSNLLQCNITIYIKESF